MDQLCGNVLELEDGRGHPVLALSSQARQPKLSYRQIRRHNFSVICKATCAH